MQGGSGKQIEGGKRLLLLRAAFDFDSLSIPAQEKQKLQKLLNESPLEAELKKKYEVVILNTTNIKPSAEYQKIERQVKESMNNVSKAVDTTQLVIQKPDIIILVSKHAAMLGKQIFPLAWFKQAQLFAVGKAALPFFADDNISVLCPQKESGEGLMNLAQLQNIKNKNVLICKGEQGLDYIEDECKHRGAKVNVKNLYMRSEAVIKELPEAEEIDVLFATSVYALQYFKNQLEMNSEIQKQFLEKPILVLSERISNAAKGIGFVKIGMYNK